MRTLHIMNETGDRTFCLETEVDLAKEFFNRKIEQGYMAYEVGEQNVQISEFNPNAKKIVMQPNYVGG